MAIIHLTFKHPAVAICGRPTKGGPFVRLEGTTQQPGLLMARIREVRQGKGPLWKSCAECLDAHVRRQFCEHGHAWRWDDHFVPGSACQCAKYFLDLRDGVALVQTIEQFNALERLREQQS